MDGSFIIPEKTKQCTEAEIANTLYRYNFL